MSRLSNLVFAFLFSNFSHNFFRGCFFILVPFMPCAMLKMNKRFRLLTNASHYSLLIFLLFDYLRVVFRSGVFPAPKINASHLLFIVLLMFIFQFYSSLTKMNYIVRLEPFAWHTRVPYSVLFLSRALLSCFFFENPNHFFRTLFLWMEKIPTLNDSEPFLFAFIVEIWFRF